jgi:hypothetical protein
VNGVLRSARSPKAAATCGSSTRLRLDDRDVRLIWFAYRSPHTVIVGHGADEITLLVVSPQATETSAARAIALASDPDNLTGPDDILIAGEATSHVEEACSCPRPTTRWGRV